jgi:uncharacterized OsmC-like protein
LLKVAERTVRGWTLRRPACASPLPARSSARPGFKARQHADRPPLLPGHPASGPRRVSPLAGRVRISHNRAAGIVQQRTEEAMPGTDVAAALQRARSVYARRPQAALHEDAPATARWSGGTRVDSLHPRGHSVHSDMPAEFGGAGDAVSPGWLFRAGLAACTATCIALVAAERGVSLGLLEVEAGSRSDARGLLGMQDEAGLPVPAASRDLRMNIRLAADDAGVAQLEAIASEGLRRSPVYAALAAAALVATSVEVPAT